MSTTKPRLIADLGDLVDVMRMAEGFAEVRAALLRGESAAIDGAWGSSCALATAALVGREKGEERRTKSEGRGAKGDGKGAKAKRDNESPAALHPSSFRLHPSAPVLLVVLPRISEIDDFAVDLA